MAYILYDLLRSGYSIGAVLEGISSIDREHEEKGVILFYDDLPKANTNFIKSIFKYRPKSVIMTARIEEIDIIKRYGSLEDVFKVYEVKAMSDQNLRKMFF